MIRKIAYLFAVAAVVTTTSCKKGEITGSPANVEAPATPIVTPAASADTPQPAPPPANGKYPVLRFAESTHDFGEIGATEKVTYNFKFENTGEADLIISKAVGSCGCTVPEYPKDPIKPGQTAEMKVSFDPTNKKGKQSKTVMVYTNTKSGQEQITITASIKEGSATATK
ncbi:MAG TPA: DUF1573 domain-containing protein [Flavobacterium sp.]|jgi:hypothetical protein